MFNTQCSNPSCPYGKDGKPKDMHTFATSKLGTLPVTQCSEFCKAEVKDRKRFISNDRFK